jgi:hypothetical protein
LETVSEPDRYALKFRLQRGLGDALAGKDEIVPAIAAYKTALSESVRREEQIPELLFSLADLYQKSGDDEAAKDARGRAVAAINELSTKPVTRDD